jgi:hypothetical protein
MRFLGLNVLLHCSVKSGGVRATARNIIFFPPRAPMGRGQNTLESEKSDRLKIP